MRCVLQMLVERSTRFFPIVYAACVTSGIEDWHTIFDEESAFTHVVYGCGGCKARLQAIQLIVAGAQYLGRLAADCRLMPVSLG